MILYEPVTFPPLSGAHVAQAHALARIADAWGYILEDLLRMDQDELEVMLQAVADWGHRGMERAWKEYHKEMESQRAYEAFEARCIAETEWSLRAGNV